MRLQKRVRRMNDAASPDNKAMATVAATASTAAVVCGVCCVLPLALPAAFLATFGSVFAFFESAYPLVRSLSVLAVSAGWTWVLVQSWRSKRRPARSTLVIMTIATIAMAVALMWPWFEVPLAGMLR